MVRRPGKSLRPFDEEPLRLPSPCPIHTDERKQALVQRSGLHHVLRESGCEPCVSLPEQHAAVAGRGAAMSTAAIRSPCIGIVVPPWGRRALLHLDLYEATSA